MPKLSSGRAGLDPGLSVSNVWATGCSPVRSLQVSGLSFLICKMGTPPFCSTRKCSPGDTDFASSGFCLSPSPSTPAWLKGRLRS